MNGKEEGVELIHTRDRIISSALKLFSRKGFRGTTIKDIAQDVGLTEGAIYRHFESKEDLIEKITEMIVDEIDLLLSEEVMSKKNFVERIEALVESLSCYAFNNPDHFRFLTLYHLLREDLLVSGADLPGKRILDMLRDAYRKGELDVQPEVALGIITGTVNRVFLLEEVGLSERDREELIEEMKRVILRALNLSE